MLQTRGRTTLDHGGRTELDLRTPPVSGKGRHQRTEIDQILPQPGTPTNRTTTGWTNPGQHQRYVQPMPTDRAGRMADTTGNNEVKGRLGHQPRMDGPAVPVGRNPEGLQQTADRENAGKAGQRTPGDTRPCHEQSRSTRSVQLEEGAERLPGRGYGRGVRERHAAVEENRQEGQGRPHGRGPEGGGRVAGDRSDRPEETENTDDIKEGEQPDKWTPT